MCVNNRLCALILATGWEIDPHKLKFGGEIVDTIPVDRNIVGGVCMISFYLWSLDVYTVYSLSSILLQSIWLDYILLPAVLILYILPGH